MNTVGLVGVVLVAVLAICLLIKTDRDIKKRKNNIG